MVALQFWLREFEAVCSCFLLRAMPNGDRRPFRIGQGSPSPAHTSDSEDTSVHKRRYRGHQLGVALIWRGVVLRCHRERNVVIAMIVNRLGNGLTDVARRIADFLRVPRSRDHRDRAIDWFRWPGGPSDWDRWQALISPYRSRDLTAYLRRPTGGGPLA